MKNEYFTDRFYLQFNIEVNEKIQQISAICNGYGLEDPRVVERLEECGLNVFCYIRKLQITKLGDIDGILDIEDYRIRKDLASLVSIFGDGRSITIDATMPDGDCKEKHITIPIETGSLLQIEAFGAFMHLLAEYGLEEYESMTYADIIRFESGRIDLATAMKGRKVWEIPKLGCMVHDFIEAGGDGLASLTSTQKYCLIGDLIWELLPSTSKESMMKKLAKGSTPDKEWATMDGNDKSKLVKSWEKSYMAASRKIG